MGRVRLGTLLGLAMGVGSVGGIIGPPLAGWVFDSFGSYQGAWFASTGVAIVGMFLLITAPSASEYSAKG